MLTLLFDKSRNHCQLFLLLTLLSSALFSGQVLRAEGAWNWQTSPEPARWKEFHKLSPTAQAKLWKAYEARGQAFEKMAWEWRLGWIQSCANSEEARCASILQFGLFDRALVVRAQTAALMGDRFAGTGHQAALRLLSTAYAVQQNRKNAEPLYVQYRILHAIKQIGGKEGLSLGAKLAKNSDATARYWTLIGKGDEG